MKRMLSLVGLSAFTILIPTTTVAASVAQASGTVHGAPNHLLSVSHDVSKSTNWAGYAVQSKSKFTDVKGSWIEPAVKCTSSAKLFASFWVGIDGYNSDSVEQLGTDSDCRGTTPHYYGWYEMYPADSVNLSSKYPVAVGDKMTAEVKVSGSTYTLSMSSSEGWNFSIKKTVSGLKDSSAEWIAESPEICNSSGCKLAKLPNFSTVKFTGSEAATGGADEPISSFPYNNGPHEIVCATKGGTIRMQPSKLSANGENFTVSWKSY